MNQTVTSALSEELNFLVNKINLVTSGLKPENQPDISDWAHALKAKLIPMFSPDFPLLAAICGGGSSGKSTLFNAMVGKKISPTGGRAGINRRVLVAFHENFLLNPDFLSYLFEPFGCIPEPLTDITHLISPGPPVYITSKTIPPNLILLDTPDFDTGSHGSYTNRASARRALQAADVLLYIFTNSNYKNRDNTDFIANVLSSIGKRHCFLVYRIYPSFSSCEIKEHAMTVAQNIYGNEAEKYILGIFRADEDNSVAAGDKFMQLYAVNDNQPSLFQTLQSMDSTKQRRDLWKSILNDVIHKADEIRISCELSIKAFQLYLNTLNISVSHGAKDAFDHSAMERVMAGFKQLWHESDPRHIKQRRKKGDIFGFPLKAAVNVLKWAGEKTTMTSKLSEKLNYREKLENNFSKNREKPRNSDRQAVIEQIINQQKLIVSFIDGIENELKELAEQPAKHFPDPVDKNRFGYKIDTMLEIYYQHGSGDIMRQTRSIISETEYMLKAINDEA